MPTLSHTDNGESAIPRCTRHSKRVSNVKKTWQNLGTIQNLMHEVGDKFVGAGYDLTRDVSTFIGDNFQWETSYVLPPSETVDVNVETREFPTKFTIYAMGRGVDSHKVQRYSEGH